MEKFETGDKVKVVRMDTYWDDYTPMLNKYLGMTGVVGREVLPPDYYRSRVNIVFENGNNWWFNQDWLELVEKKQKGWTGKVIVVGIKPKYYMPLGFTPEPGQIYTVEDGCIKIPPHSITPRLNSTFADIWNWFRGCDVEVLEFKGFCKNGKE